MIFSKRSILDSGEYMDRPNAPTWSEYLKQGVETTTAVANDINDDLSQEMDVAEPDERPFHYLGDKKVSTFYIHMSIVFTIFIVCIAITISGWYCVKRREFRNRQQTQSFRRRSTASRKGSRLSNEHTPINNK